MKKIKLILVGYGPRGKNWLQIIKKNKKTEIIAICDINEKTKDKYTIEIPFYTKISHALLESKADGIILSTPPFNRMKDVKACAKYRLPILVEKPLAVNFKEAISLVNFMNQQKLLLMVGLNFRYLPSTLEKIKLIKSNKVGKPHFSKFIYERWRDGKLKRLNKYPLYMKHPMLWEQSIHHFDLIRYVYNSNVKTVFATTSNPPWSMYKYDSNVNAILELNNGILVNYIGNWQSNSKILNFEWRTECSKGVIIQKKQFSDLNYIRNNSSKSIKLNLKKIKMWEDDSILLLKSFIKNLESKTKYLSINRDHLNSLAIVDACIKSSKTGRKIRLKNY